MHIELSGLQHPGARTLVLSAGLGGSGNFWLPQLNALRSQYRVVVYDHRGTGGNPDQLPEGYSMTDMAAELAAALARHDVEQYEVIGHALGGMVAMQMALDYPQRVTRLAIVNGWLRLNPHTRRCFSVRQQLLMNVGVEAWVQAQPLFLYPADWLAENQERIEAEDALHTAHFQGVENLLHRLNALMNCDFTEKAKLITQPALVICSQDDLLVPCTCSETLSAALPRSTLLKMAWGGHAMSVTDSAGFNRLLLNWLNSPVTTS
ncbi:pyrimidine utilization protein D [Erwinia psidii]|uniref:Putative carbamate hydrolase RutD n=1 Tax=Erwinia psidii TaxID=69224 RepID=A0A3N6SE24_9GAMM|nr:pyrimidine utilization protein D [Erwinia psidii]MCX8957449.1 pyrimidine utilization protein D [Erwinia psidii]MCX8959818.1 pyrimidine utilization protein D [Erwinia psidii]MCX8964762.1 pyrimidine utilization protein D [Erwinia psidii]RQM38133.1 pyrimidine utilization protein D [Erwinia psidii]